MVLASYMCLTLLWSENAVFKDYVHYLRRPVYLFVFLSLTIELVLRYPKFIDHLFVFFFWVAAITGIVSILWFYSSHPFPRYRLMFLGDQVRNPIEGASVYGMFALVCCFHFLNKKKPHAWIYNGLCVAILFSAALTQSRGPWLALLITFPIGAVLTRDKKLLATVLCVILIGVLMFFFVKGFKRSILRPRGVIERLEVWEQILERTEGSLFFGKGISADRTFILANGTKVNHSHNIYIGTIFNGGLMGLFLMIILQGLALWEGFQCFLRKNDFTYVALLLFAFICITTMNYRIISHPDVSWMYFWLPLALLAAKKLLNDKVVKTFYPQCRSDKSTRNEGACPTLIS